MMTEFCYECGKATLGERLYRCDVCGQFMCRSDMAHVGGHSRCDSCETTQREEDRRKNLEHRQLRAGDIGMRLRRT